MSKIKTVFFDEINERHNPTPDDTVYQMPNDKLLDAFNNHDCKGEQGCNVCIEVFNRQK